MSAAAIAVEHPPALSRGRVLVIAAAATVSTVSLVLLLPALAGLPDMWNRVTQGDVRWLAFALGLEVLSFAGHIVLFRAVCVDGGDAGRRIGMRESTLITLAGHAATRLFASAGAGGVALTAWAMRRAGMERAAVAARMTTFLVLLYSVYMAALVIGGLGLWAGLLPGEAPLGMTLVPAAFGALVIGAALVLPRVKPGALADGVHDALRMARRLDPGLIGALMWWAFDVAVLWACFKAFGEAPAVAVVVVAYFVGMLANTLPLPGGIGGVDGGMIGALVVFGVDAELAVVAVLAYRGFAFWLPIAPGVLAYLGLRRTVAAWDSAAVVPAAPGQRAEDAELRELFRRAAAPGMTRVSAAGLAR
jgi:uncharacterized membrane protein YbhN (UPF0104 family)